jgi:two-component system, NtrC family, sensor kinase
MIMLVVDDDRFNLRVAEDLLLRLHPDSTVLLCQNPLEVESFLNACDVDLLFLDIVMPVRDGMDVLSDIRSKPRHNDMPIIMLSSMTDMKHFNACFNLGANDFVSKPIHIEEFQARLKGAMQTREHMKLIRSMYEQAREQNNALRKLNGQLQEAQFHMVQQEKLAAIGQLAAGVAHEINNPIGFVSSNVDTLKRFFLRLREVMTLHQQKRELLLHMPGIPEEVKREIRQIEEKERELKIPYILSELDETLDDTKNGTERVTRIVQTLRNFARSGMENRYESCLIDSIVDEAVLIVHNEAKYTIDIHRESGPCEDLVCNRGEIGQVIVNLLVNAIQAIKQRAREDRGNILIRTSQEQDTIVVVVEDDGPGIPESIRMKVFDPFFTTKDIGLGTGLGLSISHDIIVNKHQGELILEDSPTGGARFTIRLPRQRSSNHAGE